MKAAMEEDELNEFLGLPSDIGRDSAFPPTGQPTQSPIRLPIPLGFLADGVASPRPEQNDTYHTVPFRQLQSVRHGSAQPYHKSGNASAANQEMDSRYNALFGEETATSPSVQFPKPDLQTMESLGHEPLFPDVDETKIKPTVGLGSNMGNSSVRVTPPQKEEFTIVLDPSSSDPRFGTSGNVPVADWVAPSGHRREPMLVRQGVTPHHPAAPAPRPAGLHSSAPPHGPMHGRNVTGAASGSRSARIPPGCNPELEPEFPTRAAPDQALKLPGQTRVTPDEYKEFLGLGHGEIFNLDLDRVVDPPWRAPAADTSDFFNYGLDENTWKDYCKAIECHRQEFSMKKKIQTYESSNVHFQQDPDLPPEVAAAIAAETYQARAGTGPDMTKALPIPVFQGADDYSLRNRRGRDFRRPEVRYDPEVILELAGGVEASNGVNADYGEDYISAFGPGDLKPPESRAPDKTGQEADLPTSAAFKTEEGTGHKSTAENQSDSSRKAATDDAAVMFGDDEEMEDPRSRSEMVRPGELAMGMEADPQQTSPPWPAQKLHHPAAGAPPRPEFSRMYDPYGAPHDMWRPFSHGRGWRPRGPPYERGPADYWGAGRGFGRSHVEGGRGGRYWSPYGGPRRPGRRPPPPRYHDGYRPPYYPPWARREDRLAPPPQELFMDEAKATGKPEHPIRESFPPADHVSHRDRDRRRHSVEREEERSRSHPRLRGRDYDGESRSLTHHRERSRDYARAHRRDDYDDRHREKRRRGKSSERETRRRGYSKERSRGRDRDDRRSRRHETYAADVDLDRSRRSVSRSDSESEPRYRARSKDRT